MINFFCKIHFFYILLFMYDDDNIIIILGLIMTRTLARRSVIINRLDNYINYFLKIDSTKKKLLFVEFHKSTLSSVNNHVYRWFLRFLN